MAKSHPRNHFVVFEATNKDLGEIYISFTLLPLFKVITGIAKNPPHEIKHWDIPNQEIIIRTLASELNDEHAAKTVIAKHISKTPIEGWRYIVQGIE